MRNKKEAERQCTREIRFPICTPTKAVFWEKRLEIRECLCYTDSMTANVYFYSITKSIPPGHSDLQKLTYRRALYGA